MDSNSLSPVSNVSSPSVPAPRVSSQFSRLYDRVKSSRSGDSGINHLIAGSTAGMAAKTLLQPLDLVKVRLQVQDGTSKNEYRGITHAVQCIVRNEGFFGLYRGLTPNLMAAGISWGVYFFTYNQFKDFFKRRVVAERDPSVIHSNPVQLGPFTHLACAAASGMTATTITNPFSMVKTRLQLQGKDLIAGQRLYTGVFDAFRRIVSDEGFLALYRGLGPSLVLVSNGALQFMSYEELKRIAIKYVGGEELLTPGHFFFMGGLAKVFSATVTYPFAVTRARLFARPNQPADNQPQPKSSSASAASQSSSASASSSSAPPKYHNMRDVFSATWHREGWRGFYRGLVPQLIKTAPASAITFLIYETAIKMLNKANPSSAEKKASIGE